MADAHDGTDPTVLLQMRLECIGIDGDGLMVRVPGPNPDGIARLAVYRCATGATHRLFRADVDCGTRERVSAVAIDDLIAESGFIAHYVTYTVDRMPSSNEWSEVVFMDGRWVVLEGGTVLASASSSRENDEAAELWVQSAAAVRRRGWGRRVAAAWIAHIRRQGKMPLYSHRAENLPSRRLARSLGAVMRFDLYAYDDLTQFGD